MQYADPNLTWANWVKTNDDRDEPTKLLALHEYIYALALEWNGEESITAAWLNKKLAKLGIPERIAVEHRYDLEIPVTATMGVSVYGTTRAEALEKLAALVDGTRGASVVQVRAAAAPVFVDGPQDVDPAVVDPDAPTTVDGTLTMLREIIMLGHIAGPKYCVTGANNVLNRFGLPPVPPRQKFTVTRPVEAVMSTVVEAYDEESARRVGGWRWENDRTSYKLTGGTPTDDMMVI